MARTLRPARRREGRGLGERLSESFIFIMLGVGLIAAAYWYFMIYRNSPQVAAQGFLSMMNRGGASDQYAMLTKKSQQSFGSSKNQYDDKCPLAHGLAARISSSSVENAVMSGSDKWTADVNMTVRQKTESLLSAASDTFKIKMVMRKESDGWKLSYEESDFKALDRTIGMR